MATGDTYQLAVERLRDVTRNRMAVATNAVEDLPHAGRPTDPDALTDRAEATYKVMRPMEDAALRALSDLYTPACDYQAVSRAVEEADAGWLYPVILDRALDSLHVEGGDA